MILSVGYDVDLWLLPLSIFLLLKSIKHYNHTQHHQTQIYEQISDVRKLDTSTGVVKFAIVHLFHNIV